MTPEQCPSCGTKLEPEMLACPNCPMSFPEDEPSSGVHPLRQTKAYAFLIPALFFAIIGGGVWYIAMGLFHLGEQNAGQEVSPFFRGSGASTDTTAASNPSAASEPLPADLPALPVEPDEAADAPGTVMVSIAPPEPARKKKAPKEWRLRGSLYDLATLRPVGGCSMVFVDEQEGRHIETRSRSDGSYRVVVPPLPDRGYAVTISKPGYSPAYLNPGTEGVAEMPSGQRAELAKELSSMLSASPYSVQAYDERPLVTDFYLAPRP